ncbi:MAG: pyruvate kinase alpha/beta domain-containing protein [Euryarchaeota archaeon]|nr:pyruvate kinase alpha/beta domain-containing protein [Euryarchaeota archaeon]
MKQEILYFEKKGKENTEATIKIALKRAEELGIKTFVMASTRGHTAEKFLKLAPKNVKAIVVTHQAGFKKKGEIEMSDEMKKKLIDAGMELLTSTHALSGVGRGISKKFEGVSSPEIIAHTLRLFSQGMKVCAEIAVMAADAGIIVMDEEIMTIGGTGRGADTAAVVKPIHSFSFFDLDIKEILTMPRNK